MMYNILMKGKFHNAVLASQMCVACGKETLRLWRHYSNPRKVEFQCVECGWGGAGYEKSTYTPDRLEEVIKHNPETDQIVKDLMQGVEVDGQGKSRESAASRTPHSSSNGDGYKDDRHGEYSDGDSTYESEWDRYIRTSRSSL